MSNPDPTQLQHGGGGGGAFRQGNVAQLPPYVQGQGSVQQPPPGAQFQYAAAAPGGHFSGSSAPDVATAQNIAAQSAMAAQHQAQAYVMPDVTAQANFAAQSMTAQNLAAAAAAQGAAAGGGAYMTTGFQGPGPGDQPPPGGGAPGGPPAGPAGVAFNLAQHQARMSEMLAAGRAAAHVQEQQEKAAAEQQAQAQAVAAAQSVQQQAQGSSSSSKASRPERKRPARKSVSPQEAWDTKFKELEAFFEEFGHSDVPQTYKPNRALGKWVGKQREHYRNIQLGKPSPLTEDRKDRLMGLDFKFSMGKGQHAKIHGIFITEDLMETWEARYKDLLAFKEKYQHVDVPVKYPPNRALGRWVALQRRKFRELETNKISSSSVLDTRMQKLRDLGFKFSIGRGDYVRASSLEGGLTNHDELWEERFKLLEAYKEEHGNCDVPQGHDDKKLASWVTKQREQFKLRQQGKPSSLTDDRLSRLEDIGFHFRAYAALWEERLEQLKQFKEKHGHVSVKTSDRSGLYIWVTRQRQTFRDFLEGRAGPMDHDRIRKLEDLGFNWKYDGSKLGKKKSLSGIPSRRSSTTPSKRTPLSKKSDIPQPPTLTSEKPSSEKEVTPEKGEKEQDGSRHEHDVNPSESKNEESVSETGQEALQEKEDQVEKIEVITPRIDDVMLAGDGIELIGADDNVTFPAGGNSPEKPAVEADLPDLAVPNVGQQLTEDAAAPGPEAQNHTPLVDIQIDDVDLDGKPLKRGTKPEVWLRHYEQLLQFKMEKGHVRVPCKYKENKKLGSWVKLQREDYKKMKDKKATPMCKYRIDLLEKIGFEWRLASEKKTSWEDRWEALKEFKQNHGHCDVPQAYPKDVALGKWVSKQRDFYRFMKEGKATRMTQERVDKLEELGFRWVIGKGKALRTWEDYFRDLIKFKEKHGHTNIPFGYRDSPALGTWAAQQRKNFIKQQDPRTGQRKGLADRLRRLEELGFHFHVKEPAGGKITVKAEEPRKRGRPRKVDLQTTVEEGCGEDATQSRGRPKKSNSGEAEKKGTEGETPKKRGKTRKSTGNEGEKPEESTGEQVKKRGRPKKLADSEQPKKRGRPKKVKAADDEPPKKRGKPRKISTAGVKTEDEQRQKRGQSSNAEKDAENKGGDAPKKRGRPRKTADGTPKKRGRPRKQPIKSEEEDVGLTVEQVLVDEEAAGCASP